MASASLLVEILLPEAETGPGGLAAEEWKPYPYGWSSQDGTSERVAAAMALDMQDDLLEEALRFVISQYDNPPAPLEWRISVDGKIVRSGTETP